MGRKEWAWPTWLLDFYLRAGLGALGSAGASREPQLGWRRSEVRLVDQSRERLLEAEI